MTTQEVLDARSWAERTFGNVQLHDVRRTRRTVQAASKLAENPEESLPAHMQTWKESKALYRLLDEPDVSLAALLQPHFQQTREQATALPVVLLVQDTTDIDLSHRRHPSVGWDKSVTNEDEGSACRWCWPCDLKAAKSLAAWLKSLLCARLLLLENSDINGANEKRGRPMCGCVRSRALAHLLRNACGCMSAIEGQICSPSAEACQATATHFLVRAAQNRRTQQREDEIGYS
jgi:hypothetical protein